MGCDRTGKDDIAKEESFRRFPVVDIGIEDVLVGLPGRDWITRSVESLNVRPVTGGDSLAEYIRSVKV